MKNKIKFLVASISMTMALALTIVSVPSSASAAMLSRQLQFGMSGSDVSDLQTFLAQDPTIYPQGLVTGYFGSLTVSAVSNFQARNGIATVGRVGPVTIAAINAKMGGGDMGTMGGIAPMITNASVTASNTNATVYWNTSELAKGIVYYSATPLTTYEHLNSVDVSGSVAMTDSLMHSTQSVFLQGLTANTTYYYMIYTTDQDGNVSVTYPTTFHTN